MLVAEELRKRERSLPREDTSVGEAGRALRDKSKEVESERWKSASWQAAYLQDRANIRLSRLFRLPDNWDSYGAPAPNEVALRKAFQILSLMNPWELAAVQIVASAEGGVGFCFSNGERYADVESCNDGVILGVRYVGKQSPVLIRIDGTDQSILAALQEIRHHMAG